ncbi:Bardet-Biedl syndrome 5 -like protein [Trichinella nativa]|uniref:Bardet-Biedl syndrome 5-like protein n=1 Tax=Trichinella nativa TaxID=6335 RepID=A0A0V1KKW7_9BILA|nr:Bardet-Biedl syndrome 5 -like protein [Trichinella nativa]
MFKFVERNLKHYDVIWEDRDVRYDVDSKQLKLRNGEFIVDKLHGIENTKGNLCSVQNVTNPVGVTPPAPMVLYGRGRRKNNTRIPSTRSSSRHMAALMGSERPRALTLTDGNGCLRRCAGCASTNYFEEAACRKPLKKPERARWPLRDQGKPKAC